MSRLDDLLAGLLPTVEVPSADELDALYYELRRSIYGDYVSDWSGRENELGERVSTRSPEVGDALDVLGALALLGDLDSGPLLDKGVLFRDMGNFVAAEETLTAAAYLIETRAGDDEGERVEAAAAWAMACEVAIRNGRLLTASVLVSRLRNSEVKDTLAHTLGKAIRRRLDESR